MNLDKYEKLVIKYITEKYNSLEIEMKNINGYKNVKRYTHPAMSYYVENAIALLIAEILKDNKQNYEIMIDAQLSTGSKHPTRPDIIIYDNNNVIHGIFEIKAQLGYFKNIDIDEKIKRLKKASDNHKLEIKQGNINFQLASDLKYGLIVFTASNSHNHISELKNNKKLNYFVLFDTAWYNNLNSNIINKEAHGFADFVKFLIQ